MTEIILLVMAWWFVGFFSFVWWWTQEFDFKVEDLSMTIFSGVFGLFSLVAVIAIVIFEKHDSGIVFRKRRH